MKLFIKKHNAKENTEHRNQKSHIGKKHAPARSITNNASGKRYLLRQDPDESVQEYFPLQAENSMDFQIVARTEVL
ncbi:MAG: hypothetical protein Ct9H300mP28_37940 [Pseudomonadota bacterium]|nr:MAG: hypothetical protein Ct9H300mP28_37940 [Pseudomonadota bacterium]